MSDARLTGTAGGLGDDDRRGASDAPSVGRSPVYVTLPGAGDGSIVMVAVGSDIATTAAEGDGWSVPSARHAGVSNSAGR
jgi:hypothetical protein